MRTYYIHLELQTSNYLCAPCKARFPLQTSVIQQKPALLNKTNRNIENKHKWELVPRAIVTPYAITLALVLL